MLMFASVSVSVSVCVFLCMSSSISISIYTSILPYIPPIIMSTFMPIAQAIEHFKQNKFVIVMDDESRENEGDLICAAQNVTTEQIAFLVRHSSGYICTPMTNKIADRLDLPLLRTGMKYVSNADDRHGTAYTITVDAVEGTTTGISAHDRALTCKTLATSTSKPTDFLKPGHICPLRAVDGGVLNRRGHTEAAVDLCQLSGLESVGVICELVNDGDGSMMRLKDCEEFGKQFNIPLITIDALADYIKANAN